MKFIKQFIFFLSFFVSIFSIAQNRLGSITGDETEFYAETKQVNQFLRRFNNEEDKMGVRYYPGDSLYRNSTFRKVYLKMLFDQQSPFMEESLREEFVEDVTKLENPLFLDFYGGLWFAELATTFQYHGSEENLILFLQLEQENLGYKWVLTSVYFDKFLRHFYKGNPENIENSFLHPMSHELDFMNMHKAFRNLDYIEYYAREDYKPDYLSILFFELKQGEMKYLNSGKLKFHFFQIDGWYFEISYFNRPGNNSGWLISKLYKINQQEKEELIKFYLP